MEGILLVDNFDLNADALIEELMKNIEWDERMITRKTASYGKAYNYSQLEYAEKPLFPVLQQIITSLVPIIGFQANNCLINYYENGQSTMGFHSDQIDILQVETGIAIISLGAERMIKFRNIQNRDLKMEYLLSSGSLFYMTQSVQKEWQHAIPKSKTNEARISITFRAIN